jgi:hypothetical protein
LFVAEKLLHQAAITFGLPSSVYRSGFALPSSTGAIDANGFIARYQSQIRTTGNPFAVLPLRSGIISENVVIGRYPQYVTKQPNDIESGNGVFVNVTPVDYLASSLVALATSSPLPATTTEGATRVVGMSDRVRVYHLVHASGIIRMSHITEAATASSPVTCHTLLCFSL